MYGASFCKSRQTFPSSTSWSVNEKCIGLVSQLKTAGTQKVFPLSPLRTPLTPSQKNKVCNPSLGGTGGTLFTQHYSCPAVLRCSVGSTVAAFRELLSYGKNGCLNRTGTSPALNRQGGNVRVAASYSVTFILHSENVSTNVALVARPCAPAAQRADESSSSRSRLAKSYGRFAPLSLKQDCFFRVSSSKIKISLPSPPAADNLMIFHPETSSSRLRSDSFQKFGLLRRRLCLKSSLRSASTDFQKTDV